MTGFEKNSKCMICGLPLIHVSNAVGMKCLFCGEDFYSNRLCGNGHFVCDECHSERAREMILSACVEIKTEDALAIAYELFFNKWVHMHGPEHHFLVAAVLLTSYHNRGYSKATVFWDLARILEEAKSRTMKISDGACGFWGCCGAAIGAGIFSSLALKALPLSVGERGMANRITAKCLEQISAYGGPRCCKREVFTTLFVTSKFTEEYWQMPLTDFEGVECQFFDRNFECTKEKCPFYPKPKKEHMTEQSGTINE